MLHTIAHFLLTCRVVIYLVTAAVSDTPPLGLSFPRIVS